MAALADALREPRKARAVQRSRRRLAGAAAGLAALAAATALAIRYDVPRQVRAAFRPAVRTVERSVEKVEKAVEDARSSPPAPVPARPQPSPPTPAASQASTPASTTAKPRPPRPATVELLLKSSPPGARVVRLDTNERLGKTPLRLDVRRKEASVWLEMSLDGWHPVKFTVDLRKDNTANVEFKKASRKTPRKR
jgi:hypothetical protein